MMTSTLPRTRPIAAPDRRHFLFWSALVEGSLFLAIGLRHIDKEAIAFAFLFFVGAGLLRLRRAGLVGMVMLGLLALDTAYWMVTALVTNLQSQGQPISIAQPLILTIASVVVLAAIVYARFGMTATHGALRGALIAAAAVFVVAFVAEYAVGSVPTASAKGLSLRIHNASFSTKHLTANAGQVSIQISNEDLFWHTFTVEGLPVNVAFPNGAQKQVTFTAPPGTYTFYCAIPGHRQAGMVGTIIVR